MDRLEGIQAAPGAFTRLALPNKNRRTPNKEIVAALWFLNVKFCSRLGWFKTKHNAVHCFPTACSEERRLALGTSTRIPDFGSFRRATKSIPSGLTSVKLITASNRSRAKFAVDGPAGIRGRTSVFANTKTLVGHISLNQTLDQSRNKIVATIHHLQNLLSSTMLNKGPERNEQRLRLQEDIHASKQCLEICKKASKQASRQKIHIVGEIVADDDTDQMVVTTPADFLTLAKYWLKADLHNYSQHCLASKLHEPRRRQPYSIPIEQGQTIPKCAFEVCQTIPNEVRKRAAEGGGTYPM
ncbi:hypothetical protein PspLS_10052 [Pyricularia sp. CBS 133598]|nr:hypothetical protein PspLS_10052 [Pyricularia sp. CBS 133598]